MNPQKFHQKQLHEKVTCWKLTRMHFVPVLQSLKEVVPFLAPEGADCIAIQFTSAVLLEPSLYSKIQALKPLLSTDSTQMAPPLPRVGLLIERPRVASTVIFCPPWKGVANEIRWQANSLGETVVTFALPALKLAAKNQKQQNNTSAYLNASIVKAYCTVYEHLKKLKELNNCFHAQVNFLLA